MRTALAALTLGLVRVLVLPAAVVAEPRPGCGGPADGQSHQPASRDPSVGSSFPRTFGPHGPHGVIVARSDETSTASGQDQPLLPESMLQEIRAEAARNHFNVDSVELLSSEDGLVGMVARLQDVEGTASPRK